MYKVNENVWHPRRIAILQLMAAGMKVKKSRDIECYDKVQVLAILLCLSKKDWAPSVKKIKTDELFKEVEGYSIGKESDWYAKSRIKDTGKQGWNISGFAEVKKYTSMSPHTMKVDITNLVKHRWIEPGFAIMTYKGEILKEREVWRRCLNGK